MFDRVDLYDEKDGVKKPKVEDEEKQDAVPAEIAPDAEEPKVVPAHAGEHSDPERPD